tara:strand:+ start:12660 stop:13031 length:372 start_codon:yes stop_codon:yes gene_type:complete
MTLPKRIPKKSKRSGMWRKPSYRSFVSGFACCNCGSMAGVECAHVRWQSGAGMGQKPHDWLTVPLCRDCHHGEQHTKLGEPEFWTRYAKREGQTVFDLMQELNDADPKFRREIAEAKRERGLE